MAYAVVAFILGALAGFQAIYERYGDESGTSVNTAPGYGYLLTRGAVPALSFFFLYLKYPSLGSLALFGMAIGCGLGTEVILRSQFQVKSSKVSKDALTTENSFIGLFTLLDWYQKFVLELINTRIAAKRQKMVREAVSRIPPGMPFDQVCNFVAMNAGALESEKKRKSVTDEIDKQLVLYKEAMSQNGGQSTGAIEDRYQYKLGYWVYHSAGRWHGLNVLFRFRT